MYFSSATLGRRTSARSSIATTDCTRRRRRRQNYIVAAALGTCVYLLAFVILSQLTLTRRVFHHLNDGLLLAKRKYINSIATPAPPVQHGDTNRNSKSRSVVHSTASFSANTLPSHENNKKWAYVFLLAGCDPTNKDSQAAASYRGFLAGILVAVRRLKLYGSRASFVIMIQMSTSSLQPVSLNEQQHQDRPRLPKDEEEMLHKLHVNILYLPIMRSSVHECFYATVLEKFRILTLTQYDRVMFVDADIMPKCNLDYLFELSSSSPSHHIDVADQAITVTINPTTPTSPTLKGTVILSWQQEASNAGLFIMTPNLEDWDRLQQAIRSHEQQALKMEWPYWDEDIGWGHRITPPDYWRGMKNPSVKNNKWNWFSVHSDQGLLYYFAKYIKKDVSIIIGDEIETWSSTKYSGKEGRDQQHEKVELHHVQYHVFDKFSCNKVGSQGSGRGTRLPPPYSDVHHFTGRNKPWEIHDLRTNKTSKRHQKNILDWQNTLAEIQDVANYSFIFPRESLSSETPTTNSTRPRHHKNGGSNPPVGRFAGTYETIRHIQAKSFYGWKDHYDAQYHDAYFVDSYEM